ncbi:unnamed protein product, partial [Mesorhabditis spiculigera]
MREPHVEFLANTRSRVSNQDTLPLPFPKPKPQLVADAKQAYHTACKQYADKIKTDGLNAWKNAPNTRLEQQEAREQLAQNMRPITFPAHDVKLEAAKPSLEISCSAVHPTNIPEQLMVTIDAIPLTGKETDKELHEQLENFPSTRGIRLGWNRLCPDAVAQNMYKELSAKYNEEKDKEKIDEVFNYLFPNKLPVENLPAYFNKLMLTDKKEPSGKNQVAAEAGGKPALMKMCRVCFMYGCKQHVGQDNERPVPARQKPPRTITKEMQAKMCGPRCCKLVKSEEVTRLGQGSSKTVVPVINVEALETYAKRNGGVENCCMITAEYNFLQKASLDCVQVFGYLKAHPEFRVAAPKPVVNKVKELSYSEKWRSFVNGLKTLGMDKIHHGDHHICTHDGKCEKGKCACLENGYCNKFCHCYPCRHTFPGCRCQGFCNTKQCPCFNGLFECDPDLCKNCGVCEPNNPQKKCTNVQLQRKYCKRVEVRLSTIPEAGRGLFVLEKVSKGELIGEYAGEILSREETEKRGAQYDRNRCSYLFALTEEKSIDPFYVGTPMRYLNHNLKNLNCGSRVMMVGTESRIGIYALRDIEAEEELFFDYKYNELNGKKFVGKSTANEKPTAAAQPLPKKKKK